MKLRDYQESAVDFIYERDRALVLASVGAGKTAIALTAMKEMLDGGYVHRWLVLAPKRVALTVWPTEVEKWAPELSMSVAVGTPKRRTEAYFAQVDIVVTNYDNIQSLTPDVMRHFDGIVFDELTKLKNPSGKRFKMLDKLIERVPIRWGLTGSFTSNGLEDTFGQCKIVDTKILGRTKGAFLQQYFVLVNKDYGEWAPRRGALEAVMERIRPSTFLLESKEYKDTLPPLHTTEMPCMLKDFNPYEAMKKDFVWNEIAAPSAGTMTQKLQQMASGFVYETKKTADLARPGKFIVEQTPHWFSDHKFELLDEILEENQHANTIVVYNYQEELAELKRRYPYAVKVDDRGAIERWNEGKVSLLLLHPKSAGHGLNLQAGGHHMIFMSLPWSLELYEQTVGRLHRGGQAQDVWVYLLLTKGTIDGKIWWALNNKQSISELALEELKTPGEQDRG